MRVITHQRQGKDLGRVMCRFTFTLPRGHHENEGPKPHGRKLYERVTESDQTAGYGRRRVDVCGNGERPGTTLPVRGHNLPRDSLSTLSRQRVLRGHGGQSRKRGRDEDPPHILSRLSVRPEEGRESHLHPQSARLRLVRELAAQLFPDHGLQGEIPLC